MDIVQVALSFAQLVAGVTIGAYVGTKIAQWEMKRSIRRCLENVECVKKWVELLKNLTQIEEVKRVLEFAKKVEEVIS